MFARQELILQLMTKMLVIAMMSPKVEGGFAIYLETLDCTGMSGCAMDEPTKVLKGTSDKNRCSLECLIRGDCASFNYLETNKTCLIFGTTPYMILNKHKCIGYDNQAKEEPRTGENLSKYRRSCQSSNQIRNIGTFYSWLALDNIFETLVASGGRPFCSHTENDDTENNWFMVDLVYSYKISYVRILARINVNIITWIRYKNLTVGVTNNSWLVQEPIRNTYPLCGAYPGPPVNGSWFRINCKSSIPHGRYVIVHQAHQYSIYGGYLSLCEVQVYGSI